MSLFGWVEADIVKEIGKPLAELTVAEAGDMISKWQERDRDESRQGS